jgi:uncharacterized protein (TIGR02246 family)
VSFPLAVFVLLLKNELLLMELIMKRKSIFFSSLLIVSNSSWAKPAIDCVKVGSSDIEALFEHWNDSLRSSDAQKVADTYLSDAVLLPTISNKVRLTDAERVDYFKQFLKKKPIGKIDTRYIRIGCNSAIDTGEYTFTLSDKSTIFARYTFTYLWHDNEWGISSHHSSIVPEK